MAIPGYYFTVRALKLYGPKRVQVGVSIDRSIDRSPSVRMRPTRARVGVRLDVSIRRSIAARESGLSFTIRALEPCGPKRVQGWGWVGVPSSASVDRYRRRRESASVRPSCVVFIVRVRRMAALVRSPRFARSLVSSSRRGLRAGCRRRRSPPATPPPARRPGPSRCAAEPSTRAHTHAPPRYAPPRGRVAVVVSRAAAVGFAGGLVRADDRGVPADGGVRVSDVVGRGEAEGAVRAARKERTRRLRSGGRLHHSTRNDRRARSRQTLFALCCLLYFVTSFGCGMSQYVLSCTVRPAAIRATFAGMASATGKLGALTGVFLFECVCLSSGGTLRAQAPRRRRRVSSESIARRRRQWWWALAGAVLKLRSVPC